MKNASILLETLNIKDFKFSNRYVCAPFDIAMATDSGLVTEDLLSIYKQRKGPSLIIVEQVAISPSGQYREKLLFIDRDECIVGLSKLADVIHSNNQIAVLQINHAGSAADTNITHLDSIAPSEVIHPVLKRSKPKALTINEIQDVKVAFIEAALRAKKAGFDGIEIHNCHGFLLSQFLSPLTNLRTDEYGGSLENRSRLLMEIVLDVRKAIGDNLLLLVRLGLDDLLPEGLTLEEGCIVAEKLEKAGIDILDISTGLVPPLNLPGPAMLRDMLSTVKKHVNIPVIGAGELDDIEIATDMVENNEVDFIALARPIMKQPDFVANLIDKIQKKV